MKRLDKTFASDSCSLPGVYYRMYQSQRTEKICIVCMQWFDELDYHDDRFVKDKRGVKYYWTEERDARKQMLEWYKKEEVEEEYHYMFPGGDNFLVR